MKTILAMLFLCSAAGSQVKTVHQSSKQPRCFVYSRRAMTQCIEDKRLAAELLAQEDKVSQPSRAERPDLWILEPEGCRNHTCYAGTFYTFDQKQWDREQRCNRSKAKAGAHGEPSGKPDAEKPEKKLP